MNKLQNTGIYKFFIFFLLIIVMILSLILLKKKFCIMQEVTSTFDGELHSQTIHYTKEGRLKGVANFSGLPNYKGEKAGNLEGVVLEIYENEKGPSDGIYIAVYGDDLKQSIFYNADGYVDHQTFWNIDLSTSKTIEYYKNGYIKSVSSYTKDGLDIVKNYDNEGQLLSETKK